MVSNQGSVIFTQQANGFLAYKTDYTNANISNSFINEVIALRNSYTFKFTSYSSKNLITIISILYTNVN